MDSHDESRTLHPDALPPSGSFRQRLLRLAKPPRAPAHPRLGKSNAEPRNSAAIHARSRQTYGSPRILVELRKQGARPLRSQSRSPDHARDRPLRPARRAAVASAPPIAIMTNRSHPTAWPPRPRPRLPTRSGWATSLYIETQEGWLYLAGILDAYSRKIVGWAMSERIDTNLVLKALALACWHRQPPANLLFHSDRGVQYASGDYRQALKLPAWRPP